VGGVVFNFTNSIIGAGAIGLGGAIAQSGGLVSLASILLFALLTKISLDLVIQLSVGSSYEQLGYDCYGRTGWAAVLVSKMLYSFGCLVAYVVVVRDNFASALSHLIHRTLDSEFITVLLSTFVLLPLCLTRDMTPLASLSLFSVLAMGIIILIVLYLFFGQPDIREEGGTFLENWLQVRLGFVESLGTFVFSFVSHHTVHLAFESLRPELQTLDHWKLVSSLSIGLATVVSLSVGFVVYATFWEHALSDLFTLYPDIPIVDVAKLLLCITMLLTFPFPFFTCRDMMIVAAKAAFSSHSSEEGARQVQETTEDNPQMNEALDLEEPLLPPQEEEQAHSGVAGTTGHESPSPLPWWLIADRQLCLSLHILVTVALWFITTLLAIYAPNLGDVLDLVGCATGTVIAFILPALFYFRKEGYSHTAAVILVVGGIVGMLGTLYSTKQLLIDGHRQRPTSS
jgi:amino acid permease